MSRLEGKKNTKPAEENMKVWKKICRKGPVGLIFPGVLLLCVFWLCVLPLLPVQAASRDNDSTGYQALVQDNADLMSEEEEEELLSVMYEMTQFGNAYCYTTEDEALDTYNYAGDRYEEAFGTQPGSVFLIAMGNRQLYLYNEGTIKNVVTSSVATSIVDRHYSLASAGEYAACAREIFSDLTHVLSGRLLFQPLRIITVILLAILLAVLINYVVMVNDRRRIGKVGSDLTISARTTSGTMKGINTAALAAAIAAFAITSRQKYRIEHDHSSGSGGGHGGGSYGGGGGHSGGGGGHSGSGGGHGF